MRSSPADAHPATPMSVRKVSTALDGRLISIVVTLIGQIPPLGTTSRPSVRSDSGPYDLRTSRRRLPEHLQDVTSPFKSRGAAGRPQAAVRLGSVVAEVAGLDRPAARNAMPPQPIHELATEHQRTVR